MVGALASASGKLFAQPRATADVALAGGLVITMNPRQPTAEVLAVRSGRILAVGDRSEIDALCGQATRVVNLTGKCVSPGLIDAHSHLIGFGQMELYFTNIRPPRVYDFRSLCEVLAEACCTLPPRAWLVARGFNEFDEGHFPRRWDIDDATGGHPALLIHWSGQFGIADTAGLLDPKVQDPPGGMYLRDRRRGEPDGCLLHYPAIYSAYQPSMTDAQQAEAAQWGVQRFAREGVTCVQDNFCNPLHAVSYVRMEQRRSLPLRLRAYPYVGNLDQCVQAITRIRRYEGRLARFQGIKLAVDGYPLMYDVLPQHSDINLPMHSQEEFQAALEARTIAAAHAALDEDDLGALEPGKFADLAVWNLDLRQVTENALNDLEVVATYLAGTPTYEA